MQDPTVRKITYLRFIITIRSWSIRFHEFGLKCCQSLNISYPFWKHPKEYDPRSHFTFGLARVRRNRLEMNMLLAKSALQYVKDLKIHSANLPESADNDRSYARQYLTSMRHLCKFVNNSTLRDDIKTFRTATISARCNVGNCGELADNAYQFLKEVLNQRKVDYCYINNGGHVFIVIGRQDNSNEDYRTWGPHAVVCDPWSKAAFPAAEIESQLKDWDPKKKRVKDFNPSIQLIGFEIQDRVKLPCLKDLKRETEYLQPQLKSDAYQCLTHLRNFYNGDKKSLESAKISCEKLPYPFHTLKKDIDDYVQYKMNKR